MGSAPSEPSSWPSVTVVLPTLGERADLLELALQGIRSQDYPGNIDCLVVLDVRSPDAGPVDRSDTVRAAPESASTDSWASTRSVAAAAGARVLENERTPGLAGSRNTGIVAADGELVAFCDDDDRWLPGKLRAQVTALGRRRKRRWPAAASSWSTVKPSSPGSIPRRPSPFANSSGTGCRLCTYLHSWPGGRRS